jgi:hypothetical protein
MSELSGGEPQFERMEPRDAAPQGACSSCNRSIPDTYYEAAGRVFCEPCRDAAIASLHGGSSAFRVSKALLLGTLAAAVSAVVWYAIVKLTGYELGIIAIAVGFAVGVAVRFGAEQRGGWAYQTIAVLLTYLAIAASYVPLVYDEIGAKQEAAVEQMGAMLETELEAPPADESFLLANAIVISILIPVLQVMNGGFIGLLIVCFALYEAWKINKRQAIAFSGPFRLQRTAAESRA